MTQPTDDLIIWASSDVNLPNLASPNKSRPIDDLINKGWDFTEKPAADEFNYILNNLGMHVSYLEENKTYTFSGDVTGTATSSGTEDVDFNISVNDNSHNHISSNISDATSSTVPDTIVKRDANGNFSAGTISATLSGNASTSSTLQTSRTINGTSFNGSTNITTNSWGYSRNLAFTGFATGNGNVDGSGNVSIELSMGSGFTTSKATNGYTYLPNGMIFQWGYTNGDVTFPITFPNACLNASLTSNNTSTAGYDYKIAASNLTTTGFSITRDSDDVGTYVYWFAIGF